MKKIIIVIILASFTGTGFCVDRARVRRIFFRGAKGLSASQVKKVMSIQAPGIFSGTLPWAKLPFLNEAILKQDINKIIKLYEANGYFDASVRYSIGENNGKAYITIFIDEGSYYIISEVVGFTEDEKMRRAVLNAAAIFPGERFIARVYDKAKTRVNDYLVNNGYGKAKVEGKVIVNKNDRKVSVQFYVDTGPLQYLGTVSIEGNTRVKSKDIMSELTFGEGYPFSRERLSMSQRNIYNLGLFKSVRIIPGEADSGNIVPVNISVDERDKREVRLGIGYGNEDKVRALFEWNRYYLFDSPRTLGLSVRYSDIMQDISARFSQRYIFGRKNDLAVTLGVNREDVESYTNERIGSQVIVNRKIGGFNGFIGYNLELNRPTGVLPEVINELKETEPGKFYFISSIISGIRLSAVNDPSSPTGGMIHSLYIEPSSFITGSGLDYVKGVIESRVYNEGWPGTIFAVRAKFGFIEPLRFTRDIPIFKRFFSGGSYSVRGYGFQEIGPKDIAADPLGGHYLTEGSIELRYPVYRQIKGVIFLDAGNVYLNSFDFDALALKYGTGFGLRYATPLGLIGADIAVPFDYGHVIDVKNYKIYFTLGQVF